MKLEFLGTGGATVIPRPLCSCRVCAEARDKGVPYSRTGPGLFVHGPDLLIDTSEDISIQLNRSQVKSIKGVIYSHWHPDHVMGRRVLESMNADWVNYPPKHTSTDVYLPEQVTIDFKERLGSADHLNFFSYMGFIEQHELKDGDTISLNGYDIYPFRLAEDYVYAFLVTEGEKRVLIEPDELNGWQPDDSMKGVDLAVLPMGLAEYHPLTGERVFAEDHPVLKLEATFKETLAIIKKLQPKRTILTHVEEIDGLSYDDLKEVEKQLKADGLDIEFAYDTMVVEVK
ncbi:MBL fold metallo-hydrolase [Bacillus marinisedimentorum]|uniref:MBL fold metallo-hydrolase n=1 Tax=Bacillus marinisedimentorum TaxID=1821260 RepID=UPI0007DF90A1|nr:MBL fold metallo-hydrolase [Bacillus marinisedimentorum]